jgi:MoxR-like ATPase
MANNINLFNSTALLVLAMTMGTSAAQAQNSCDLIFKQKVTLAPDLGQNGKFSYKKYDWGKHKISYKDRKAGVNDPYRNLTVAWKAAEESISLIKQHVYGSKVALHALLTGSLAKEFVWVNGDPGGAKTFLARLVFDAQLKAIPEKDKRVFLLQFHQLLSEGVITGFPKIQSMIKDGKYEIETSTSLVGDKFLFAIFDEAEKANTATLSSLLSVLNERKAFLGSKTVYAALVSGVFTSNKTMADFIDSFEEDRPTGEALADRMGIKVHTVSQMATYQETVMMYNSLKNSKLNRDELSLPLHSISDQLLKQVKISDAALANAIKLVSELDGIFTPKADQSLKQIRLGDQDVSEYFPSNQFSNRSMRRLIKIWKSSFIADQLMAGTPIDKVRTTIEVSDLHLLSVGAIYNGPATIRRKHLSLGKIEIQGQYGEIYKVEADLDPYTSEVKFISPESQRLVIVKLNMQKNSLESLTSEAFESEKVSIDQELAQKLIAQVQKTLATTQTNIQKVEFEVESTIEKLIAKGTLEDTTIRELQAIQEDAQLFTQQLNAISNNPINAPRITDQRAIIEIENRGLLLKKELAELKKQGPESQAYQEKAIEAIALAYKELNSKFRELDHSINAHMVSILSGEHIYSFGPPGGAKTALGQTIIEGVLADVNHQDLAHFERKFAQTLQASNSKAYKMFFLQFHKMVPEGVIVGFPKVQSQIDTGKIEYDFSSSLAHKEFLFAILDEVEKGNPAVLTSLLAVLNEREVFAGNTVHKAALRTAVLTSNKVPSEFLDSFGAKNRPTGAALLDRTLNKNYVSNKFSDQDTLFSFIKNLENGTDMRLKSPLPLDALKPLVGKVQLEEHIQLLLAKIHESFMKRRLEVSKTSRRAHNDDFAEYPNYYVMASSPSNRTFIRLLDQFKAQFILDQVKRGTTLSNLNFEVRLSDLHLFLNGLGHWGPFEIKTAYDNNGIIRFELEPGLLGKLKDSPRVNSRNRYVMQNILDEAKDFTDITNAEVHDLLVSYREIVAQFPNLFPSLFATPADHKDWLKKAGL